MSYTTNMIKIKIVDPKIKYIDLFAGTGAFSLAFLNASENKFKCVFANDMIKSSENIYKLNNPKHNFVLKNLNEINTADIPEHDILCGGFPCQPFSIAGEKKGFDDTRSNVFWKILEIIKYHMPNIVILENVKNLKTHDKCKTFKTIIDNLSKIGYLIKFDILDTSKITNIPHHRERIYIICFKNKKDYDKYSFDFEKVENMQIKSFLQPKVEDKYYYSDRFVVYDKIKEAVIKNIDANVLYQYRRHYVRENKSNFCPTLTANMGGGGHNVPLLKDNIGIRKLTPRECFNLQGFPHDYKIPKLSDSSLYKLSGNAVSVPVIQLIINKICKLY
jgi:DNA (cytosine-5)-methyltransferase 1